MRTFLFNFIEERWAIASSISGVHWSDMITMSHNTAVTDDELSTYGSWGITAEAQLAAWKAERDTMYGSPVEVTAFVEWLKEWGIPIAVRVWRRSNNSLVMSSCIGDAVTESEARIVVDLHHTGRLDTNDAHYKLIRNASFAPSAISTMLALAATREELAAQRRRGTATQVGSSSTVPTIMHDQGTPHVVTTARTATPEMQWNEPQRKKMRRVVKSVH